MRDALGGVVNLAMIVVFLVLVCGYLAFNVNYTKARNTTIIAKLTTPPKASRIIYTTFYLLCSITI